MWILAVFCAALTWGHVAGCEKMITHIDIIWTKFYRLSNNQMQQFMILNNAGDIEALCSMLSWSKRAYFSNKIVNNSVRNDNCHFRLLVCFDFESSRKDMFVSHKCIMF